MTSFSEKVYEVVAKIPAGKVTTYGAIAAMISSPRAARQVGWVMAHCPPHLPWHRVLKQDGSFGPEIGRDYAYALLQKEGVPFLSNGKADISHCFWQGEKL